MRGRKRPDPLSELTVRCATRSWPPVRSGASVAIVRPIDRSDLASLLCKRELTNGRRLVRATARACGGVVLAAAVAASVAAGSPVPSRPTLFAGGGGTCVVNDAVVGRLEKTITGGSHE
jgi:hypothetical protein